MNDTAKTLIGVAAVIVVALVAMLFLRPGNSSDESYNPPDQSTFEDPVVSADPSDDASEEPTPDIDDMHSTEFPMPESVLDAVHDVTSAYEAIVLETDDRTDALSEHIEDYSAVEERLINGEAISDDAEVTIHENPTVESQEALGEGNYRFVVSARVSITYSDGGFSSGLHIVTLDISDNYENGLFSSARYGMQS